MNTWHSLTQAQVALDARLQSYYLVVPANASYSHSIINKPFLYFIFNGLFSF